MARRIVWTQRANIVFTKLLEYYILRNESKEYSRKLNKEINSYLVIIGKQPFLGMKTNDEGIYVIVKGNFKIYYQIEPDSLVIILIWKITNIITALSHSGAVIARSAAQSIIEGGSFAQLLVPIHRQSNPILKSTILKTMFRSTLQTFKGVSSSVRRYIGSSPAL